MARARNIKPGFFKNEILGVADPLYSLLFEGLWVLADRSGRMEDRPLRIKGEVFPYRDGLNVDAMLNWLESNGFIRRYTAQGKKCILVLEFVKHQNPHKNEKDKGSDVPAMTSENIAEPSQAIDLDGVDKITDGIEINREENGTAPADSLFPLPDSCSLIPDTNTHESGKPNSGAPKVAIDFSPLRMTTEQVEEVKRIRRKNKCGAITQRVVNTLAKEFELAAKKGWGPEDILSEWELRGWKGFKAEWVTPNPGQNSSQAAPKPREFSQ